MAGRKENLKSLFTNTRTRVIIIFTAALIILAVVIGFFKLRSSTGSPSASAELSSAPSIQSIPGSLDPTAQYAKLQEEQNITQAANALKTGKSAIPTLIRTQAIGEGGGAIGSPEGKTGVGFKTLASAAMEGTQQSLWLQSLQNSNCSKTAMQAILDQGGQLPDLKPGCTCLELKNNGYALPDLKSVCDCKELKTAGYLARDLKDANFSAGDLRSCGYSACDVRNAGFSADQMKEGGFSDGELKGSGFNDEEIAKASGIPPHISMNDIRKAGCEASGLTQLQKEGVSAALIKRVNGCTADQLKAAGYTAKDLKNAGFSAGELKKAGFPVDQLHGAGFTPKELDDAKAGFISLGAKGRIADCSVDSLKKAKANGVSVLAIKQTLSCSAKALKDAGYTASELKNAGFTAAELKNAGFTPKELKDAGFSARDLYHAGFPAKALKDLGYSLGDLRDAGITPAELKNLGYTPAQLKAAGFDAKTLKAAGFSPEELKGAGFSAKDLKNAGFTADELRKAGFSPRDLKQAGFSAEDLRKAGFNANELKDAGFPVDPTQVAGLAPASPTLAGRTPQETQEAAQAAENTKKLQAILARQSQQQSQQQAEAKYQQKIQQKTAAMVSAANQFLQEWKKITPQQYVPGKEEKILHSEAVAVGGGPVAMPPEGPPLPPGPGAVISAKPIIKTGDILFAVIDTAVNTDEPGPILATIVSGKLKGSKLIGSFNLPPNANRMVISFNTLSMLGAPRTTSVSAFAIDPNTGRTALSSRTNHHYLLRYGSLFASSFLEGFGNAFQAANTAITIGGTGGGNNITVQSGIGQSALENAVIGLATVGKSWGQQAQLLMNRPTTVLLCAGTGVGVLFTQDVSLG
jgi:intracellular multiplication protein IcmE